MKKYDKGIIIIQGDGLCGYRSLFKFLKDKNIINDKFIKKNEKKYFDNKTKIEEFKNIKDLRIKVKIDYDFYIFLKYIINNKQLSLDNEDISIINNLNIYINKYLDDIDSIKKIMEKYIYFVSVY